MKILYLHQYFNTPNMNGGTRSYEMASRMVKAGHEVHMITTDKNKAGDNWSQEVINGINVHWLPVKYNNKMGFLRRVIAFFMFAFKAGNKAKIIGGDIIFATSTPLTIAIPAIQAKKALNIPMVFEVRDLWPELPIAIGALKSPLTKYLAKKLELWAYSHSDSIIGLSPGMCEGVISTGYPEEKVHNIPNSCDISMFNVPALYGEKFRQQYEWLKDNPLVIYAGTLGRINGVSYLAELANKMLTINSNVRFLVVGNGIDEVKIKSKAIELGVLDKNFFMLPAMKKNEMPALFSAATISVSLFIPLKEMRANSANKFFDTLSSGTPVAINYKGWQKEIIEKANIGLILDDKDYNKAAHCLYNFLVDSNKIETAKKLSKEVAVNQFSRDKLAQNLISVLEEVSAA